MKKYIFITMLMSGSLYAGENPQLTQISQQLTKMTTLLEISAKASMTGGSPGVAYSYWNQGTLLSCFTDAQTDILPFLDGAPSTGKASASSSSSASGVATGGVAVGSSVPTGDPNVLALLKASVAQQQQIIAQLQQMSGQLAALGQLLEITAKSSTTGAAYSAWTMIGGAMDKETLSSCWQEAQTDVAHFLDGAPPASKAGEKKEKSMGKAKSGGLDCGEGSKREA